MLREFLRAPGAATSVPGGAGEEAGLGGAVSLRSVEKPRAVYEKGPTCAAWSADGRVLEERFRVALVDEGGGQDGVREVGWEESVGWELSVMVEEEWERQIGVAGLRIVETVEMEIQRVYVLARG